MNEATENVSRAHKEINLSPASMVRFWAKVNKDGPTQPHMTTPCWVWTASTTKWGYGRFRVGGVKMLPHRIMWSVTNGKIPLGMYVCHQCDNPRCCRVDHLYIGTQSDNMIDMNIKGRSNQPRGDDHFSRKQPERLARGDRNGLRLHPERAPRGERNGSTKLTTLEVIEIRALYIAGDISYRQLANQFGVTIGLIGFIIRRESWKHI